jgi:hypothetical protein
MRAVGAARTPTEVSGAPHDGVEKASWRFHHDRGVALPRVAVRSQAIAPAQGDKQSYRPKVRKAELYLLRLVDTAGFFKFCFEPYCSGFRRVPLAGGRCPT